MKIRSVRVNNKKKTFEINISGRKYSLPYVKAMPTPTPEDPIARVFVDKELGREALTFGLASGKTGTIHLEQVIVWGRTPKRRKDFIKQMSKVVKADWKEADTVDEVEAASDILVVSTDSTTPVATGGSLKDEVLVASIGANATVKHEVSNNLIRRMDLIVVDDLAAAKADSGDLVEACQTRIARWEDIIPLEKFVAQGVPQPRPKRIFFQSNGIADEDLAVGKYALDQAKRKKLKLRSVTEI